MINLISFASCKCRWQLVSSKKLVLCYKIFRHKGCTVCILQSLLIKCGVSKVIVQEQQILGTLDVLHEVKQAAQCKEN